MMKKMFFCLLILFSFNVYSLSPVEEYDFLIKDLYNCSTCGYKSTFDTHFGKSNGVIDFSQGRFFQTNMPFDIAVQGKGFFRVKDIDGNIYYTRYGKIFYDGRTRSLCIQINRSCYFLDLKPLPYYYDYFSSEKIQISKDGSVVCLIPQKTGSETNKELNKSSDSGDGLRKETVDKILLYDIKDSNVYSYDGCLIKTKTDPEVIDRAYFISGAYEQSNVSVGHVLIRLLFVIEQLDKNDIKQKEVKKYLIQKILEQNFSHNNCSENIIEKYRCIIDVNELKYYVPFLERSYE